MLGDLRPYICLHMSCLESLQGFQSRRDWMKHVMENHFDPSSKETSFTCCLCGEVPQSQAEYRRHVGRHQLKLALFALPELSEVCDEGISVTLSDEDDSPIDMTPTASQPRPGVADGPSQDVSAAPLPTSLPSPGLPIPSSPVIEEATTLKAPISGDSHNDLVARIRSKYPDKVPVS